MKVVYFSNNQKLEVEIYKKKLEPKEIIKLFKKKYIYFSKPCRKNNLRFFINGEESREQNYPFLNAPDNSKLSMSLIGDYVKINYWTMQFNFKENEPISDVINKIKKRFKGKFTICIYNEKNLKYEKEDLIKKTKTYKIEVKYKVKFLKESNGHKETIPLDYYSTVGAAQEQLSAILNYGPRNIYIPPEKVEIQSKNHVRLSNPNVLLCNIQDLHEEFLFDYQCSYSTNKNHKKHKKNHKKNSDYNYNNQKEVDYNYNNYYNYYYFNGNNSPEYTDYSFHFQNPNPQSNNLLIESTPINSSKPENQPKKQETAVILTDKDKPKPETAVILTDKNKPKQETAVILTDKDKPKQETQMSKDSIQVMFKSDNFYPLQKEVPLSFTIEDVKELISTAKGLNKEKISIKYERNNKQIEVPSGKTISDISDLMKTTIGENKEIYLLFVSSIDDQKTQKKSISQFKPRIKREDNNKNDNNDDDDETEKMSRSKIVSPRISKFKPKVSPATDSNDNLLRRKKLSDDDDDPPHKKFESQKDWNDQKSQKKSISKFKPKIKKDDVDNNNNNNDDDDDDDPHPKKSQTTKKTPKKLETQKDDDDEKPQKKLVDNKKEVKLVKYFYQTNRDDEDKDIEVEEGCTVFDMKEKLREAENIDNSGDIKIIFAGKELLNDIIVDELNIGDVKLFVYIRTQEDILLLTAKALRVDEYSYSSEEEEEEETDD